MNERAWKVAQLAAMLAPSFLQEKEEYEDVGDDAHWTVDLVEHARKLLSEAEKEER